jgi:hypothetical protein
VTSIFPPADRIRPPIRDTDRPKGVKPTLTRSSIEWYLKQLEGLYQDWFLIDKAAQARDFVRQRQRETMAMIQRGPL